MNISSADNTIDCIIKENKITRFATELQNTQNEERKTELKDILALLEGHHLKSDAGTARDKLNNIYQKIDENSLKKKWNRLQLIQKIDRTKEFLKSLIKDETNRNQIQDELIKMLNDGELKTMKYVKYDHDEKQITSIEVLTVDPKTNIYSIIRNAKKTKSTSSTSKNIKVKIDDDSESD